MKRVFAKLRNGERVLLTQDCDCVDHEGPHWLYANDKWREANKKLEEIAAGPDIEKAYYARLGLISEESARIDERLHAFNVRGITCVFYEEDREPVQYPISEQT